MQGEGIIQGVTWWNMEVLGPFWNFVYYSIKDFERVEDNLS